VRLQLNVAELPPLITISTVEPEAVNVAVPVTTQLVVSGALGQLTDTFSVAVVAVAVKEMLPGTVFIVPPQLRVKL
jgi:hypothetical protein